MYYIWFLCPRTSPVLQFTHFILILKKPNWNHKSWWSAGVKHILLNRILNVSNEKLRHRFFVVDIRIALNVVKVYILTRTICMNGHYSLLIGQHFLYFLHSIFLKLASVWINELFYYINYMTKWYIIKTKLIF